MRELVFDGYWEGQVVFSCDCCFKTFKFSFDDEESAKSKEYRQYLKKTHHWVFTTVNGHFKDFCSESCRNKYIRNNT